MNILSRRALVRGAAWAAPVVAVASTIPAYAASATCSLISSKLSYSQMTPDDLTEAYHNQDLDSSDSASISAYLRSVAEQAFPKLTLSYDKEVSELVVTAVRGSFKMLANTYPLMLDENTEINDTTLWSISEDGSMATYIGPATQEITLYTVGELVPDSREAMDPAIVIPYAKAWFADRGYTQEKLDMLDNDAFRYVATTYRSMMTEGIDRSSRYDDKHFFSYSHLDYVLSYLKNIIDTYWETFQEGGYDAIRNIIKTDRDLKPKGITQALNYKESYAISVLATSANCPSSAESINVGSTSSSSTGSSSTSSTGA